MLELDYNPRNIKLHHIECLANKHLDMLLKYQQMLFTVYFGSISSHNIAFYFVYFRYEYGKNVITDAAK